MPLVVTIADEQEKGEVRGTTHFIMKPIQVQQLLAIIPHVSGSTVAGR